MNSMDKFQGYLDRNTGNFVGEVDDIVFTMNMQTKLQEVKVYIPTRSNLPVRIENAEKLWRTVSKDGWLFKNDERGYYYVLTFTNHIIPSEVTMKLYKGYFEKLFHTHDVYDTLPF